MSAGAAAVAASVDRHLFLLLQANLVAGRDPGISASELESVVPLMDRVRTGKPVAIGQRRTSSGPVTHPVTWDGSRLARTTADTGTVLELGDTATGFFARLQPCQLLQPGDRLGPVNAALMALLDEEHGTGFGPLEPAPSLREEPAP